MPFKSKAQMRKFYSMERDGELPKGTAQRWADETPNIKSLPERVKPKKAKPKLKKVAFCHGFMKVATSGWNLSEDASEESRFSQMQNGSPGANLREGAETGQARGRATRTQGVLNEDRDIGSVFKKKTDTARGGGATRAGRHQ